MDLINNCISTRKVINFECLGKNIFEECIKKLTYALSSNTLTSAANNRIKFNVV